MFILWKELVTSFPVQLGIIAGLLHSPVVSFTVSPQGTVKKKKIRTVGFWRGKKKTAKHYQTGRPRLQPLSGFRLWFTLRKTT